MRILVAEPIAEEGIAQLREHHEVDVQLGRTPEELAAIIGEYDALVVRSQVDVDAKLIAAGKRLTVIGRAGVGVDNVDLDAATRAGITVVNAVSQVMETFEALGRYAKYEEAGDQHREIFSVSGIIHEAIQRLRVLR